MNDDDYIWCPNCHGFGATNWVDDARGGHWVGCMRCGGLGLIPRVRLTPVVGDAAGSNHGDGEALPAARLNPGR